MWVSRSKAGIASLLTPPQIQCEAEREEHRHADRMNRKRRTEGAREKSERETEDIFDYVGV